MHVPVEAWKLKQLQKIPMFLTLYNESSIKETDIYAVVKTFRYFTTEYQKAVFKIRDVVLSGE